MNTPFQIIAPRTSPTSSKSPRARSSGTTANDCRRNQTRSATRLIVLAIRPVLPSRCSDSSESPTASHRRRNTSTFAGDVLRNQLGGLANHCWVLKTQNLKDFAFLTIRRIHSKAEVKARIEHVRLALMALMRRRTERPATPPQCCRFPLTGAPRTTDQRPSGRTGRVSSRLKSKPRRDLWATVSIRSTANRIRRSSPVSSFSMTIPTPTRNMAAPPSDAAMHRRQHRKRF